MKKKIIYFLVYLCLCRISCRAFLFTACRLLMICLLARRVNAQAAYLLLTFKIFSHRLFMGEIGGEALLFALYFSQYQ